VLTVALIALLIKMGPALLKGLSPWGCDCGIGTGGGLCECNAPVDPIGSDTRVQQHEPARRSRPLALQRTLPTCSKHAPGHRRVCACGTASDGVFREADGPLATINGTQPRINANEVFADRAQAQFRVSSAAPKSHEGGWTYTGQVRR
jgi:hypothetical protein